MKTNIRFWSYLALFFLEWEMFQIYFVQKIKRHILCSIIFFLEIGDNAKNISCTNVPQYYACRASECGVMWIATLSRCLFWKTEIDVHFPHWELFRDSKGFLICFRSVRLHKLWTAHTGVYPSVNAIKFSIFTPRGKSFWICRRIRAVYLYLCTVHFVVYFSNTPTNAHI